MFWFVGMKALKRALPLCLALGLLWAVFAACDTGTTGGGDENVPGTLPAGIAGKWDGPASDWGTDSYTINAATSTLVYDDGGDNGEWDMDYTGTIEFVSNYTSDSGVIIVKRADTSRFNAIYYRNLTAATVQMADAYDIANGYISPSTATLNEAKEKFTLGRIGDFVGQWGSYTKSTP